MPKEKITKDTFPRYKPNPILAGLPDFVKDPANYNKIQMDLLNALGGAHSHSDMVTWASCLNCQNKLVNFRDTMNKIGFKSPQQYIAWKRVMAQMINTKRVPLR